MPVLATEQEMNLFLNGTSADLLMWSNFDSPEYAPHCDDTSPYSGSLATSIDHMASTLDDPMSSVTTTSSGLSLDHFTQDTDHVLQCEQRALKVLRSLQYSPALCSTHSSSCSDTSTQSSSSKSTTVNMSSEEGVSLVDSMETVLAINKAALSELIPMLACCCADKCHIALLHLTILSKIVFWYNVIVTTRFHSAVVELKPMKMQLGTFDLDDDDHATLYRAVISRELQRTNNAIQAFELKLSTTHTMSGCNGGSAWGRLAIRAIREDLESTVHELEARQMKPFQSF
ncbi:hypothetical protein ACEQ8H_004272 [Pleosporales sp. CAS-2024a]